MGGSKATTILYCSHITVLTVLYYLFIELDMCIAKNQKVFKMFFLAFSVLDNTVRC